MDILNTISLNGCSYGINSSTLVVFFRAPFDLTVDWGRLDEALSSLVGRDIHISGELQTADGLVLRAAVLANLGARAAGLPVFDYPKLLFRHPKVPGRAIIAMPALPVSQKGRPDILAWALDAVGALAASDNPLEMMSSLREPYASERDHLSEHRTPGTNSLRFLEAAHAAGIPWRSVAGHHHQFGWGRYQVRAQSSIFSTTNSIAVAAARDKLVCTEMLRQAGLPVPSNRLATSENSAVQIAQALGFPVVVKPANLDGGVGVSTNIRNEEQVRKAWQLAKRHSPSIMVEKHQPGEDFRLIVLDGRLIWAVGRKVAGVEGDGVHSVAELVEQANRDPRRGYHATATLRPLVLDLEAEDLLQQQGLERGHVVPEGQFVRLRYAANLSSGGTPVPVMGRVHPDNRSIAEAAVKALDLDLGGVDLIIPDISVSWRQSGSAIIEVNAKPQLIASSQHHLYDQILKLRVPQQGRLPIVMIVGERIDDLVQAVVERPKTAHPQGLGIACKAGLFINGQWSAPALRDACAEGQAMLMNRDVTALLHFTNAEAIGRNGLAYDRFDYLVLLEDDKKSEQDSKISLPSVLAMVAPHCQRGFFTDSPHVHGLLKDATAGRDCPIEVLHRSELPDRIIDLLELSHPAQGRA